MSPDLKRVAADCWRKGSEAMGKENWDYAIEMFRQAVNFVPDNLMYRQALRGVECRKYGDNKSGARMAGVRLVAIRGRIKKAKTKEDWKAVEAAAEDGLALNPWDAQLNADLGEACRKLGYEEVARFAYEKAVEAAPENKEFNQALAEILESRGEYANAIKIWERVQKIDPYDTMARTKITGLQASAVMDRGGYEGAESTQDVLPDYEVAKRLGRDPKQVVDGPGISQEADLKRAIRKEPDNKENYLKLADFFRRAGRLEEAAETLQQALQVSGGDINIREQLEDVQLMQMRHNLALAKQAAAKNRDDKQAQQNAAALAKELVQREIEVLSSRVERYPADMRMKYQLGQRLMRQEKWRQAIPLFQQASNDTRIHAEARVALAECFIADHKHDLAYRQLEKALPEINATDRADLFKKAHYLAGRLAEKAGRRDTAEQHYSEVLAVDYEFRDARRRLEKLQASS